MKPVQKYVLYLRAGLVFLAAGAMHGQSVSASPAFEVATIRASAALDPVALRSGAAHIGMKIDGARVDIGTASLLQLICSAYLLKPWQVSGPAWLKSTNFDVQATIPTNGTTAQVPEMLQALLAERFGLKAHREDKEQPAYALVVAKGGPRLTESGSGGAPDVSTGRTDTKGNSMSVPTVQGEVKMTRSSEGITLEMPAGEINAKVRVSMGTGAQAAFHLESPHITMKTFADLLNVGALDRPVVDMTNLTAFYDVAVDMSAFDALAVARNSTSLLAGAGNADGRQGQIAQASDPEGASILSSIQKMGLRLERRKLRLPMLVIDRLEKIPTAN